MAVSPDRCLLGEEGEEEHFKREGAALVKTREGELGWFLFPEKIAKLPLYL